MTAGYYGDRRFHGDINIFGQLDVDGYVYVDGYVGFGSDGYINFDARKNLTFSDDVNGTSRLSDLRYRQREFEIYVDAYGSDDANGTADDPIASIKELANRIPLMGEMHSVFFGAGSFRLNDNLVEFGRSSGAFGHLGGDQVRLNIYGTYRTVATFTISCFSNPTLFADGSPEWTPNEHVGRFVRTTITLTGQPFTSSWVILSNTNNSVTFVMGSGTPTGFPTTGSVDIIESATTILPPTTNPTQFINRLFVRGNVGFDGIIFADGFSGPTSTNSGLSVVFNTCTFHAFTQRGIEIAGNCTLIACVFDSIGTTAVVNSISPAGSFTSVTNCLFNNCTTAMGIFGSGGYLQTGTGSMIAARNVTTVFSAADGAIINDNSARVYVENVTDYISLSGQGTYGKGLNAILEVIDGYDSPTRNMVRITDANNHAGLFDTEIATITPVGAYIHMDGEDVTLTEYATDEYIVHDAKGNRVTD